METTTAGQWIYVGKAPSSTASGRGTQVGTLGGSWSTQVDHGGGGGFSGGHGTATTFLDRDGNVIYLRVTEGGDNLYYRKSTDGGANWGPVIPAYLPGIALLMTGAPVALYDANYTRGEYIWYAGFGGIENALRVIPLWQGPRAYQDTGSVRLFGSSGGDLDAGSAYEYNFGNSVRSLGGGGYVTGATDLAVPGRLLDLDFSRTYNSANGFDAGALGPAWTHSYHWWLTDNGAFVTLRRGSGRQDKFTRQLDGTYTRPPGVFDTLVKTADTAYTLTTREQIGYDFIAGRLTKIHEPAGNQITFGFTGLNLVQIPLGGTAAYSASRCCGTGYEPDKAANGIKTNWAGSGTGWQVGASTVGDWWKVTWSAAQSLTRVRLWDFGGIYDFYGPGHLEFSDGSSLSYGLLPNDAGPGGEDFSEVSFTRKSGITWMKVITDGPGAGWPGLSEVEAYDDENATPTFDARLNRITDSVGRPVLLGYASDANLALGHSYTVSVPPTAGNPDTGGTELTDGMRGASNDYSDVTWQEHYALAGPLDVTVDLTVAQPIGVVRSYYYDHGGVGITKPDLVEVLTSTDNVIFTSRGTSSLGTADVNKRFYIDVTANVIARYVRLRITKGIANSIFSSEIRISPLGATPPSAIIGDRLVSLTDSIGRKTTYGYDATGRLTTVVDKLGNTPGQDATLHTWRYAYDGGSNHISSITDPEARVVVANTYDTLGRVWTQKDGLLNTTTFGYAAGQVTITDPRLHVTTQTFDARNRLLSVADTVDAIPYTLSYTYDGCGNRDSVTDRRGKRTGYTYDCAGNMLQIEEPQLSPPAPGYQTTFQPDARNNPYIITDARGFVTTNDYDPVTNRLLAMTQQITKLPDTFAITKWQYTDGANPGLPTRVISPRGNTTGTPNNAYSQTLAYFSTGELRERVDADGNKTTYTYDGASRQLTMVDPDGNVVGGTPSLHTWTTVPDPNDRVKQVTDPLGHSSFTSYDGAGNVLTATDRNANITANQYDNAARLRTVKQKPDPVVQPTLEYTTTVLRDGNGNAAQVTQDKQGAGAVTVTTDYGYDALNRLTSVTTHPGAPAPANLTTAYVLDGNGNATRRTTADGVVTDYTYDAMSRLRTVTATAAPAVSITYDYDELSRRISMIDETGTSTYGYDGMSRLTQAIQPNGTLGYGYDLDSNRTTLTYPTVGSVTSIYSPAGRLSNLTDWASRPSTYSYSAAGLVKTLTVPGGMTTTYTYDEAQRLTTLVNATAAGTITSHTYTLDNEGNRTAVDELMAGGAAASVKANSDTGTTVQDHPSVAIGADNAAYLIWDDARDGNASIYFDRRDPVTGLWGTTDVKVNTDTGTRIQQNPAITMDASSNAYAVWQDERNGAGKADIFFRKRTAAGTWVSPDVKVSDDPGASGGAVQRNPRIAGTPAGVETAVWVDLRASQNNIYSSQLVAGGTTWPANKKITDNTAALKDFPDVAVDAANTAYAVWQDSRNGNPDIFFSSLISGATNWAANVKISDETGAVAATMPRLGSDSAGNLTVVWLDARTTPIKVRAARRPAGGAWSASIEISPAPASAQSLALAVRPDGYAWASWGDVRAGASNSDIWASRYDPNLNSWSAPQRLDDDPGTTAQLSPAIAFSVGETMLAWRDNRLSANGDTQARRVVFAPGLSDHLALAYDGLNRLKSVNGPVPESFALDGASNVTNRSGTAETYDAANRLRIDGSTTNTWSDADRLVQRGSDILGYDALDRLRTSTIAGTARTYTYNGDSLLKSRTQGTATQFLWDPSSSPSRLLKQGSDNIVYGLGPLYVVKADATTLTFARDGSKNVRAEISSSGAVSAAFRYRAYGQTAQGTIPAPSYLGLASQLIDPSGLYYMRARWYDALTGRFLTRDPVSGESSDPRMFNRYYYAGANPVLLTDPSGACPFSWCDWLNDGSGRSLLDRITENLLFGPDATFDDREGVRLVSNAHEGILGTLTARLNGGDGSTTFSSTLIVSSDNPPSDRLQHEFGHISQARDFGLLYLPAYVAGALTIPVIAAYERIGGHEISVHDAHPMENDANVRAGLGSLWWYGQRR
jgi:RHS repeat-associated protein